MARVILDGYNLLLRSGRGAGEDARAALAREAGRYRGERNVEVTLVFDSRSGSGSAAATAHPGVRVEFARGDADSHILALVRKSRSPRDVLVVTSDRRLAEQARDLGARVEDGESFGRRASTRAENSGEATGPRSQGKLSPDQVEEWMRVFSEPRGEDED